MRDLMPTVPRFLLDRLRRASDQETLAAVLQNAYIQGARDLMAELQEDAARRAAATAECPNPLGKVTIH